MSAHTPVVPAVDREAEQSVLGALLLRNDPKYVLRLIDRGLSVTCFYYEQHRHVYAAMISLAKRQTGIDHLLVRTEMERLGTKNAYTPVLVDELASWVPAAGNVLHYADLVIDMARWRKRGRVTDELRDAVENQNADAWDKIAQIFHPADDENNVIVLRTVNQDGELVAEEHRCPGCSEKAEQVKGLEKDLRSWRTKCANLERDKERDAREDGMWQLAQRLFELWKSVTNHKRSPFSGERFFECAPFLRRPGHGPRMVARAIVGIAHDPYITMRRNGTEKRYDEWFRIFINSDKFEECVNKAPKDWEERLPPTLRKLLEDDETPVIPANRLRLVAAGGDGT